MSDHHLDRFAVVNLNQNPMRFTVLHRLFCEARQEAERLALSHPDQFAIMRVVATCHRTAPVEWHESPSLSEIPF